MTYAMLENVDSQLARLMNQIYKDGEVILLRDQAPIAKVVPLPTQEPKELRPGFGSGKYALIYMADDFDAPLEDFKDYM